MAVQRRGAILLEELLRVVNLVLAQSERATRTASLRAEGALFVLFNRWNKRSNFIP